MHDLHIPISDPISALHQSQQGLGTVVYLLAVVLRLESHGTGAGF